MATTATPSAVGACEKCGASRWIFTMSYTAVYDAESGKVKQSEIGWDEDISRDAGICCKGCGYSRHLAQDADHPAWTEIDEAFLKAARI